jgi:hypothetical protein
VHRLGVGRGSRQRLFCGQILAKILRLLEAADGRLVDGMYCRADVAAEHDQ